MCLAGCDNNSSSQASEQGTSPSDLEEGRGTGTTNGGASATCRPFVIEHETVATTPGARTRSRIGIGEEVNLSTNPSTSVTWTIESDDGQKGTLSSASGTTSKYTACDRSKTVTIKAESACGQTDTQRFTVVQPTSGRFGAATDISSVTPTTILVGFSAPPAMMPNDVSFYNCEMREGTCWSTSSGVFNFTPEIEHADTGAWVPFTTTVGSDGTELNGNDTVNTGTRPLSNFPTGGTTNGSFLWPIPWRAQVKGGGTNGAIVFDTVNHNQTYTATTRVILMQKGNRSQTRTVP